ncbi:MAG: polysulfide reductase NrfD [Alphaproteobacteria bacterium]|nr:polysulfide reductase NrfD [Alphaproteobacteria bacterium]
MLAWFHVPWFIASPFTGYVYPNETIVPWSELIVVYPYITGLVAGAFIASSFYHVFGMRQFKPVARFALLTALAFMIFVPVPLLFHLGHPERAFEAMITPHWTSAFAAFSYAASFYVIVLMLETWFAFRADAVRLAKRSRGIRKLFYSVLSLGSDDISEHAIGYDRRWARALAIIGMPSAALLHGYVGFVFGSLKSRAWWSSDLTPIIFLLSAVVSGVALLIFLYIVTSRLRRKAADVSCLQALGETLWWFLMIVLVVEGLEYLTMFYRGEEGITTVAALMRGPLATSLVIQWAASGIALCILTWLVVRRRRGKPLVAGLVVASLLVLVEVFAMRWNVVIGGQELSKSMRGLLFYVPPVLGRDGVVASAGILAAPLLLLWLFVRLFPPWELGDQEDHADFA